MSSIPAKSSTESAPRAPSPNLLQRLDYSILQQCIHCGLCLPTCPTYDATQRETSSPRGRIQLMRAVADGRLPTGTRQFADEMYFCLGCLACMTACPAGVNYGEMIEYARAEVERTGAKAGLVRNLVRAVALRWLFGTPGRLRFAGRLMRLDQRLGFSRALMPLMPKRLRDLRAMQPAMSERFSFEQIAEVEKPTARLARRSPDGGGQALRSPDGGHRDGGGYRVGLLVGCVQDVAYADINRDTVDVLLANGCEVVTPRGQGCCGSLMGHNGELDLAKAMVRRNLDAFPLEELDAVITNAGGCGAFLKRYDHLMADEPRYLERARLWCQKARDIHEWLAEIGIRPPGNEDHGLPAEACRVAQAGPRLARRSLTLSEGGTTDHETETPAEPHSSQSPISNLQSPISNPCPPWRVKSPLRVTYHESCHLAHGQKITAEPRALLRAIPGLELTELPEATWCCGSAGIYNITQPEMSRQLLERKMKHILATGATVVAMANTGCLAQMRAGAKSMGINVEMVHPITLLARAYRGEPLDGAGAS